jgi:hypothetical protein
MKGLNYPVWILLIPGALLFLLLWIAAPRWMLDDFAKFAPVCTAVIALVAAVVAYRAIENQRDIARRRAAIDFFLKTETDEKMILMYNRFLATKERVKTMTDFESFIKEPVPHDEKMNDYQNLRSFLNVVELIAVGVNRDAFSESISYDYWGYVLPESLEDCGKLITYLRTQEDAPELYSELEKVSKEWLEIKNRRH